VSFSFEVIVNCDSNRLMGQIQIFLINLTGNWTGLCIPYAWYVNLSVYISQPFTTWVFFIKFQFKYLRSIARIQSSDFRSYILIFSSERMLHVDYYRKSSVGKKISGRESQGAWRQDELNGGKPSVVKWLWVWLWLEAVEYRLGQRRTKRLKT
jgi:hypothetical protein